MNQYTDHPKVAALLRKPMQENATARVINGMAEIIIDGERMVLPTMESITMLIIKIASIEQRLSNIENKLYRIRRSE